MSTSRWALFLFLAAAVALGLSQLRLGPQKDSDHQEFTVVIRHFGVSSEVMEKTIALPLEEKLRDLGGLKSLSTTCDFSTVTVRLVFFPQIDGGQSFLDLRERVQRAYSAWPASVQKPEIYGGSSDAPAVLVISFSSKTRSLAQVRKGVEEGIKPQIQRLPGCGQVEVAGGEQEEIHIQLDEQKMARLGLTGNTWAAQIQDSAALAAPGTFHGGETDLPVVWQAAPRNLGELENLSLKTSPGAVLPLKAMAQVKLGGKEEESLSRTNGQERISLYVHDDGSGHLLELCERAKAALEPWKKTLDIETISDYSQDFYRSLADLCLAFALALGSALGALVLFRPRLSSLGIFLLTLTLTFGSALALLPAFHRSLSLEVFIALSVSLSLCVDPPVILLQSPRITSSLAASLVTAVGTTVLTLVPLLFSSGLSATLPLLATVLILALASALFFSLFLIPALEAGKTTSRPTLALPGFLRFFSQVIPGALTRTAGFFLEFFHHRPRLFLALFLIGSTASLGLFLFLPPSLSQGASPDQLTFSLEFENKLAPDEVDRRTKEFTHQVLSHPEVLRLESFIKAAKASFTLGFRPEVKTRTLTRQTIEGLGKKLPGCFVYFPGDQTQGTRIEVTVTGEDPHQLRKLCKLAAQKLVAEELFFDPVFYFKEFPKALVFVPDASHLASANLTVSEVTQAFRRQIFSPVTAKLIWEGRELDVRLGGPHTPRAAEEVSSRPLALSTQAWSPSQAGSLTWMDEYDRIERREGQRCQSFAVSTSNRDMGQITARVKTLLAQVKLPEGYSFRPDESLVEAQNRFGNLLALFALAIGLIYLLLVFRFNSFTLPLVILSTLPVSFLPALAVLHLTHIPFTLEVLTGFLVAVGLMTNNNILLTENYLDLSRCKNRALVLAFHRRSRGLLTAAVTAVGANIPLILMGTGASAWGQSMAVLIALGAGGSLGATLIFFPAGLNRMFFKPRSNYG